MTEPGSHVRIARRLEAVRPSPTLALSARAKALVAEGVDVVSLTAGEPDFDTPEHIKDAARQALARGHTKYTATGGIPELKAAIAKKLARDQGLSFQSEAILVSCGAKHSLYNLFQALIDPGDEVIILAPYWVSYPEMVELAGGRSVIVQARAEDGDAPSAEALSRALTPRTRAIVINSPSNPTGAVFSREKLVAMGEALAHHECLVVSDDIYEKLIYGGRSFVNIAQALPSLAARTVIVNGCSKAYAMTGWRIGYAAGPAPLIAAMQKVQDQSTSNPASISQYAAVAALEGPQDAVEAMRQKFDERRAWIVAALNRIDGIRCPDPGGAFYVFPNIGRLFGRRYQGRAVDSSSQVSEILLSDFRVAVVPGAPFGSDQHVRLSFATSLEAIEKGVSRIADFVAALR